MQRSKIKMQKPVLSESRTDDKSKFKIKINWLLVNDNCELI